MTDKTENIQALSGMTLRDYFAAHAPITIQDAFKTFHSYEVSSVIASERLAQMRYAYADAMLEARGK